MTKLNSSFATFLEKHINEQQRKAIEPQNGTFLVIAGAGSGKTRVITARITNLILHHGVEPSSIIALTFTNKAAQEMQERINKFLPDLPTKPIIATFHSYCLRFLKRNLKLLDIDTFSVIDSQDQYKLILGIAKEHGVDKLFNVKQLIPMFSSYKMSEVLNLDEPLWNMQNVKQFMELYNAYEHKKRISNYFDFDDLLYKTFHILKTHEAQKTLHHQRHQHILIDEYQDTNIIQHELLKQLTLHNNEQRVASLCAVGDEDQSIYSWRGATVKNILDFHREFPTTKKIKLEQNYRSSQRILDIANHVIQHNVDRNHKELWSDNSKNHTPLLLECLSDLQEAYHIAQVIQLIGKNESLNNTAILYRTHYQSRVLEEALLKSSIPYKIVGGIQFYERKEIKDLLAYLKLVINPRDRISFFRIMNCPLRGLGKKCEELFQASWDKQPFANFTEIAQTIITQKKISPAQISSLQKLVSLYIELDETTSPLTALETIVKKTDYINYLNDAFDKQEAQTKRENVYEFFRAAEHFEKNINNSLTAFLDDISLMQEHIHRDENAADCVQMMTLHSAKGLEFTNVILSGLEDGILPSNQSLGQDTIEEERRLFYVGITRAKEKLLITHSKYRNVFGQMEYQRPSRFLQEIPQELFQHQNAVHWSKAQFATLFSNWLQGTVAPQPKTTISASQKTTVSKPSSTMKKMQTVKHKVFGLGIAQGTEKKGNKTYITVNFAQHGRKKIDSEFLEIV